MAPLKTRSRSAVDGQQEAPTADQARTIVLNSLNYSAKTRKQLHDLLTDRGVDPDVINEVLDRFEEVGLVDDRDYANEWVRSRHSSRGLSRKVLKQELNQRGVDPDFIDEALEQVTPDTELEAATQLAAKKLRSMRDVAPVAQTRRCLAALARRGYGYEVAALAIERARCEFESAD